MCVITNWYFVGKERFDYDLSLPMPYAIIKKHNLEPVLIGDLNGVKVVIDNIKEFNEKENYLVMDDGKDTIVNLKNMHDDFHKLQLNIIKGYPIIYNWAIDANLSMNGVMYEMGNFIPFRDAIISQEEDYVTFTDIVSKKAFVIWSAMSRQQKEYMESLSEKDLSVLAPKDFFEVKNCYLDLSVLIKNKEEREKKNHFLNEIDVPAWMK